MLKKLCVIVVCAITLSACAGGPKQMIGAALGGAGGGLFGAQIGSGSGQLAATAAGALLGALVGSEIGKSMDDVDRMKAAQAYNQATTVPIGQTIQWDNPRNGHYGSVTPTRAGRSSSDEYCREYQTTVTIGGRTEQAYGIACRKPDGSWQTGNANPSRLQHRQVVVQQPVQHRYVRQPVQRVVTAAPQSYGQMNCNYRRSITKRSESPRLTGLIRRQWNGGGYEIDWRRATDALLRSRPRVSRYENETCADRYQVPRTHATIW